MEDSRLTLSDYQIIHELGSGSYGSAHLAFHVPSDTKHVIKRIKISHLTPKEVQNARQEVQVLSSLSHPYITQFRGSCEEDGFLLIAMDYCAGGDLHSLITNRNGILFPEDRVLDWFVQLCLAIKYIHDRKILHRDIKSQNIFLTDDGKVRLGDFGIAKILNSSSELARTCIGTPYYLSPEMCENKPYNNKSDIWALGCVLYEMLTLKHAFEANNMKALILRIIKGIYPPVAPRYSRDIRLLLGQIFQREPQARPSVCAVLRKTFIFKRVSKFISGCEEEELRHSLIRRKYHVPASARRVVLTRRPPDVTEPAAKYGVSLNKKVTHKSFMKPAGRLPKQVIPSAKQVAKAAPKNTERLRQDSRKRCPSEDILSSKDVPKSEADVSGKRYQRRSKSVPNAFRQNNNPKFQHQYKKIMNPSPVKLKLMLDSAGLKRREKGDNVDEDLRLDPKLGDKESCGPPKPPGWLVNEFLTKKLEAAYGQRKLVEALMVDNTCTAASRDGVVARCLPPDEGASVSYVSKPSAFASEKIVSEGIEKPKMCKPEIIPSGEAELPNPKDVKELANQSLKWQDSQCSEDDEGNDEEEVLPGMSSEHLREVMHKKLKKLFEERTKKMSQMVSERRQWAYEMEKLCTSASQNNDEKVMKSVDMTCHDTDKEGKVHHKSKKAKKLHKTTKQWDSTPSSNCLQAGQINEKLHKAPISAISDKNSLPVKEDCTVHQASSDEVIMSGTEENTAKLPDSQKNLKSSPYVEGDQQQIKNESNDTQSEKGNVKDIDSQENMSMDKVSQQEVRSKDNSLGNGIPKLLISQDSQSTASEVVTQEPASEDMVNSQNTTPSMRARWGAVRTADLEKSPLETTASEMDTTTSSDCVVVYRVAGERKQWKKDCDDIISVLGEAQIIEDRKVQCDTEETKSLMDVEKLVENGSLEQHKPALMNSTFTVKEGLKNCEGVSCVCKSHINTTNNLQKPPTLLHDTFQIDKSRFEKEMKLIGPPLLNSTFDMSKVHSDKVISKSVPVALNSTYDIDRKELVAIDTVQHQTRKENTINTTVCGTQIFKESEEHKDNLQATYTISHDSKESSKIVPKSEEKLVTDEKVVSEEVNTKTKGGLLEKLRLHMTPQLKNKYQKLDNNVKVPKSPLAAEVTSRRISANSESDGASKGTHTPVQKKKGSMRFGISGILRRLSSKHITKSPMRSRSVETMEKDLASFEDCDRAHSDSDSPQQETMVEYRTVKFVNAVACKEAAQKVTDHTSGSEDINCKFPLETSESGEVLEEDGFSVNNHSILTGSRDDDSIATRREVCNEHKTESSCVTRKEIEQSEGKGTESSKFPSNSAYPGKSFDEVSTDSGIDSQKASICQTSSTDCSNSQTFLCSSSGGSRNETGTCELQMASNDRHNWTAFSNFSEAATSTVLMQSPQIKQGKGPASTVQKFVSSHTQGLEMTKTTLLDASSREKFQDVSPVSTSGIHISFKTSSEQEDGALQSQCDNELDCRQAEQIEHESVITTEPNTQLLKVEQDFQTTQIKVTSHNDNLIMSNNQCKQENSLSSSTQQVIPHSSVKARPTLLNIGIKTTDIMQASQDSASRHYSLSGRKCNQPKVNTAEKTKKDICSGSEEHINKTTQDKLCVNMYSESTTSHNMYSESTASHSMKPHKKELFSSSDEESDDLANLRQSMEFLLSSGEDRREDNKRQQSELWHLDWDGGVVPGSGGVYGWIEEQRAKLEDELSMDLFKKAYHLLEAAQEREGCVVGESVSQVECLLGPCHHHLAYDILQLVVAESVYHN